MPNLCQTPFQKCQHFVSFFLIFLLLSVLFPYEYESFFAKINRFYFYVIEERRQQRVTTKNGLSTHYMHVFLLFDATTFVGSSFFLVFLFISFSRQDFICKVKMELKKKNIFIRQKHSSVVCVRFIEFQKKRHNASVYSKLAVYGILMYFVSIYSGQQLTCGKVEKGK